MTFEFIIMVFLWLTIFKLNEILIKAQLLEVLKLKELKFDNNKSDFDEAVYEEYLT